MELAHIEEKITTLRGAFDGKDTIQTHGYTHMWQLQTSYEAKLAVCEALKTQLEERNATSGLFSKQELHEIREFAMKVKKKQMYRKRSKQRRRAEASSQTEEKHLNVVCQDVESMDNDERVKMLEENEFSCRHENADDYSAERSASTQQMENDGSSSERSLFKSSFDPDALTMDALIAVRRAWDAFIVLPQTPGASAIPPHFVPPPPAPSIQWAVYVAIPANSGTEG
ncbi:unnamed protein product [Peronospora belbahrii]|uniref:Uncharacterized protein n=1 Tax=Peronospora belbahrii TaxID=622444 RepID=A0AAU9LJ79_9STRA|nr:unnamed protein product [Peronospora belbahrii]